MYVFFYFIFHFVICIQARDLQRLLADLCVTLAMSKCSNEKVLNVQMNHFERYRVSNE